MSVESKSDQKDYYHQTDPQYKLRWSEELREKISQSAKEHNRSMNAEIIHRLEETFDDSKVTLPKDKLVSFLNDVDVITQNSKEQSKLISDQAALIESLDEVISLVDQTKFHKTKLAKLVNEFANQEEYQIKNQEK